MRAATKTLRYGKRVNRNWKKATHKDLKEQMNTSDKKIYPPDKNFVFVDVETADWNNDRICAVGMITVQNGETSGYYTLINPQTHITFSYIHGITDADVAEAPTIDGFWEVMKRHIPEEFVFVAHNYRFDLTVLKKDLGRFGIRFAPTEILDTMWVAKRLMYGRRTYSGELRLNTLCDKLNIQLHHHNAASDISATKEVLEKLLTAYDRDISEFIRPYLGN